MGVVDNMLTDEEKSYFESNGEKELEELNEPIDETIDGDEDVRNDTREDQEDNSSDDNQKDESSQETSVAETVDKRSNRDFEKAFKTELHKRKEIEAQQAAKTAELQKEMEELKKALYQKQIAEQKIEPAEEIPDPETDPLGYHNYKIAQLEKTVYQQNQYLKQKYEQENRVQSQTQFINAYKQSAQQFSEQAPDFKEAYDFLIKARIEEHKAAGYTKEQADALVVEEEMALVSKAYQDKVNPAERIYNLSKIRGYAGKQQSIKSKNLNNIEKGIKNSKSLQSGGLPEDRPVGDNIDDMSFEEFEEYFAKLKAQSKGRF